jgi:hypothetical protein
VTTGVIGVLLLVHALAMVTLALTTSTTTFLALSRPLSLAIVGGGLAALVWWIRHQHPGRRYRPSHHEAAGPAEPARQHGPGSSAENHDPSGYTRSDGRASDAGLKARCVPIPHAAARPRLHGWPSRCRPLPPIGVTGTRAVKERRLTMPIVKFPERTSPASRSARRCATGWMTAMTCFPGCG